MPRHPFLVTTTLAVTAMFSFPLLSPAAPVSVDAPAAIKKPADAPAGPRLKLTTERVVIFKDGHGLVIKDGLATADAEGRVFTPEVPDGAVLGCFWAVAPDKKILSMRAEWDEKRDARQRKTAAVTIAELLRANLQKQISIQLTEATKDGTHFMQDGKLVEVLDLPAETAPSRDTDSSDSTATGPVVYTTLIREGVVTAGSFTQESVAGGGTLVRELTPRAGEFAVMLNEGRRIIVPLSHILGVSGGPEFLTTLNRQEEVFSRTKRLSFDFGKESAGKPVSLKLFYFTSGLRWIPTYRVSGELKDKADLALQGEILNDVTDIEHASLDLVVGVPNFRFEDTVSPLTLEQTLRRVAVRFDGNNSLNLTQNGGQLLNANFDNRAIVVGGDQGRGGDGMAPELAGAAGEQDLFIYSMKDFSLKKGARATVPLWQQAANLRHLYTYDIRARRSRINGGILDETAQGSGRSPLQITTNSIWHQLELANTGTVPWTTGAALMLRDSLPLGQDLLTYTPPTGKALLPVTVAVDLRGTFDEQELERKPSALHFDGYDYMLVKKKGTVTVTSYRKEKSDMRISVAIGGKVLTASDEGKIKLNDFRATDWDEPGYVRVNNHSDVVWEFTIEPGATKTFTYETSFFVR